MKKIISVICAIVFLFSSVSVGAFALTKEEADKNIAAQKKLYDGAFGQTITSSVARNVLRKSAGLTEKGVDATYFDIDADGKITAIDARIFLRIAAKLDNVNNYYNNYIFDYFLAIINSIKPGEHRFYSSTIDETKAINYKDPDKVVDQLNKQVRNLKNVASLIPGTDVDLSGTEDFDFAKTLKESEGKKSYKYDKSETKIMTKDDYPIAGNDLACQLKYNEIKSVKYEKNQDFTFEITSSISADNVIYTETVKGLDAITVYLKDETVSLVGNISGRFDNLTVNKAFDALTEAEVKTMLAENTSAGDLGDLEGMEEFGTLELSIEPKTLQYKNSYIKVYFDPKTGAPVGSVHSLGYAMSMKMSTVIDISVGFISIFDVKGTIEVENVLNTEKKVYLHDTNKENHLDLFGNKVY